MYQALYRKWRPSTFDEVIGQEHITQTLKNQIIANKLSHAYLFIGSRGTGKTTCARILARAVNCEHPVNGNPCGVCQACRNIMDSSCTDVVELDAASNNGVDNVRELREEAVFSPANVKYRVYIIDEVHMLSLSAFNALLKILEEPPAHLIFILATTELHKVPATILSRCQRHTFKRIESGVLSDYLQKVSRAENITLTEDAAQMISVMSEGGVRDALSILDQCSGAGEVTTDSLLQVMGLAASDTMFSVLEGIITHNTPSVLEIFKSLWMDGKDPSAFLDSLRTLLRDLLIVNSVQSASSSLVSGRYPAGKLKSFASRVTYQQLVSALNTVQNAFLEMKYTANTRLSAEICLISLCDDLMTDDLTSVKSHISQLEKRISALQSGDIAISMPADSAINRCAAVSEPAPAPEAEFKWEPVEPSEPVPAENSVKPENAVLPKAEENAEGADIFDEPFNERFLKEVQPRLSGELRYSLNNSADFRCELTGDVLKIEAEPLFMFGRINKPEVLQIFSDTASELCGRKINAVISKMTSSGVEYRPSGKLEDLLKFPEVKVLDK